MSSKAQSGAPAASLVIVIAAFVLLFVLLLPSEDRDALLEDKDRDRVLAGEDLDGATLLDENPGTVTKLREREFEHNLPSFNLFIEKEDVILKKVDSVFIESKGTALKSVPLFVRDPVENAKLTFSVSGHEGLLTVSLNGGEIFRGDVDGNIEPLTIGGLQEENVIDFMVDSPSAWQFWKNNFYDLRGVQISGTVERLENREAVQTFFVSDEEADPENIESAFIIYLVDCRISEVGRLDVVLNGNLLSSKVPDCGSLEKTFIDPNDFVEGKNELLFSAAKGRYLIDQVFVKTKLEKPIFPVYFFDLNRTQFRNIDNGTINATVSLRFIDNDERKTAVLELNQHRIFIDTRGDSFAKNVDPFVVEGSNSLRIVPEKTLQVLELKVELDCQEKDDCN